MGRFVVLEGDARTSAAAVQAGWPGAEMVRVEDAEGAVRAVLAAVQGADLLVDAGASREVIDRLCDDLRRLGPVDHRLDAPAAGPELSADERALLAALLGGASLGAAAQLLHLSRRTADRRLAAARRALGAESTSEALILAAQNGIEPT